MLLAHLFESAIPQTLSVQRRFDFSSVDNRRFIFDPVSRRFVIGAQLPKSRSLVGSHAEDWFDATGSNRNFDRCIRGWIGTGGNYRNGVIHFAPPAAHNLNTLDCLSTLAKCGATKKTILRGFDSTETKLGDAVPEIFEIDESDDTGMAIRHLMDRPRLRN